MAEDQDQRTEPATPKKLADAARKGQVASASDTRHAAMLGGGYLLLAAIGGSLMVATGRWLADLLEAAGDWRVEGSPTPLLWSLSRDLIGLFAPLLGGLFVVALVGGLAQGRPTISWHRVTPKWEKLSPLAGLRRIVNPGELAKTLAKFAAAIVVVGMVLIPAIPALTAAMYAPVEAAWSAGMTLALQLMGTAAALALAIAAIDVLQARLGFARRMRMTKQEIKDEHSETEGSPEIKARVRQIQRERARQRMMQAVPKAAVIIANPTHYSVALDYDDSVGAAPRVVAKGVDAVALRIREVAEAAGVPVVENVSLARALYAQVDLDAVIPPEHYVAVAEIISFVLRLRRNQRG